MHGAHEIDVWNSNDDAELWKCSRDAHVRV